MKPLDIPVDFLAEGISALQQPVYGLYHAYRAVWNDIKYNSQLAPDFNAGLHIHKLLDSIKKALPNKKRWRRNYQISPNDC